MSGTTHGPGREVRPFRYVVTGVLTCSFTAIAWWALLGWDQHKTVGRDGNEHGPYETWQVVSLIALMALLAGWLGNRRALVLGPAIAALTLAACFAFSARRDPDDDGLWPIGTALLAVGSFAAISVTTRAFARIAAHGAPGFAAARTDTDHVRPTTQPGTARPRRLLSLLRTRCPSGRATHPTHVSAIPTKGLSMAFFVVTFEHHDLALRAEQLDAHVDWLNEMVQRDFVVASGPLTEGPLAATAPVSALLVVRAESKGAALALIATDPFFVEGVTDALTVTGWNPVFGQFAGESGGVASLTS